MISGAVMTRLNVAIILAAANGRKTSGLYSKDWYQDFFLSNQTGLAAYWFNQSCGNFVLEGKVFDWKNFSTDPNFDDRGAMAQAGIALLPADAGTFDHYIVVVDAGRAINAGTDNKKTSVFLVGAEFDFHAHEIGHLFGLEHSFDMSDHYWDSSSNRLGEYGHRYCIMSAQAYGGADINSNPPALVENVAEYTRYGPRYSVASQVGWGWIQPDDVALPSGNGAHTLRLKSAGHPSHGHKAARIHGTDGNTYIVSYRRAGDPFDQTLSKSVVVVETVEGGRSEQNYPGVHSAALVWYVELPLDYLADNSIFQGPGFAISVADWEDNDNGSVTIQVSRQASRQLTLTHLPKEELVNEIFDAGTIHFEKGQFICVAGTYDWTLRYQEFRIPLEVNVDYLGASEPEIRWKIDIWPVDRDADTVAFLTRTTTYPPLPYGAQARSPVKLRYEHPAPDQLTLYNSAQYGVYTVKISCSVRTTVGAGDISEYLLVEGQALSMPQFEHDRDLCLALQHERGKHQVQVQILLPGDIWRRPLDDLTRTKVVQLINLAGQTYERDPRAFEQLRLLTARALGIADVPFVVLTRSPQKQSNVRLPERENEKPGPE
jgi:hypothetical protein